jgi:hypothetical protein
MGSVSDWGTPCSLHHRRRQKALTVWFLSGRAFTGQGDHHSGEGLEMITLVPIGAVEDAILQSLVRPLRESELRNAPVTGSATAHGRIREAPHRRSGVALPRRETSPSPPGR